MASNRDRMKKAIDQKRDEERKTPPVKVAAAAKPSALPVKWQPMKAGVPKKENPRTAAARDARMKARGRLPVGAYCTATWDGVLWSGTITVYWDNGNVMKTLYNQADGVFRCMEELDIAFWQWLAEADEKHKTGLTWPKDDLKPEPYPKETT